MTPVQRFARVLRAPDVARLLGAAVLARMPIGIDSLGMVLFVRAETGSFARAGLVAAAFGLAIGVSAPALGRLIDHYAHARVMLPLAAAARGLAGRARRPGAGGRADGRTGGLRAGGRPQLPAGRVGRATAAQRSAQPRGRTCCPPPTRSTASPSSWSSSPGRCSRRRSWSSPRRPSRSLVACGFVILGTIVLVTTPGVARLAPGRSPARAPPARRAGLARRAHHRRGDGPGRLRPGRHRGDDDRLRRRPRLARCGGRAHGRLGGGQRRRRPDLRRARARVGPGPALGAAGRRSSRCARCRSCSRRRSWPWRRWPSSPGCAWRRTWPPPTSSWATSRPRAPSRRPSRGRSPRSGSAPPAAARWRARSAQSWGWRPGFGAVVAAGAVTALIAVAGRATVRA